MIWCGEGKGIRCLTSFIHELTAAQSITNCETTRARVHSPLCALTVHPYCMHSAPTLPPTWLAKLHRQLLRELKLPLRLGN